MPSIAILKPILPVFVALSCLPSFDARADILGPQEKKASIVCSQLAMALTLGRANPSNPNPNWQVPSPPVGIGVLPFVEFDIDIVNKKVSFPRVAPTGGPFEVDGSSGRLAFIIRSVADPKVATSRVSYTIDMRTGAYIMKDENLGIKQVGVCAATKTK